MIGLFGATGFTGTLTARWLTSNSDAPVLLAGRNRKRLEAIAAQLPRQVELVICDASDPASLKPLAERCDVVLTTAGPFVKHGPPLVAACVENRAHYVDITGEPGFVRWSQQRYHAAAASAGVRIVHCAGFDALPHDVGAYCTAMALPAGDQVVNGYVWTGKGQPSGGTWRSAMLALTEGLPPADPRIVSRLHRAQGGYAVPLPTVDPQIVLRSAELVGYGRSFRYGHHARVKTLRYLLGGALAVGAIAGAAQVPFLRRRLTDLVPDGSGPDEATRAAGWMQGRYVGMCDGVTVTTSIRTDADAGYSTTAAWLASCGLALLDGSNLPDRSGVLTPVAALEQALLERLPATGTWVTTA